MPSSALPAIVGFLLIGNTLAGRRRTLGRLKHLGGLPAGRGQHDSADGFLQQSTGR